MARSILASLSALGDLPQGAINLTRDTINNAADYWAKDNAQYEKTNPGLGSRVVRGLNPMTALGSAMGSMQDAAGNGDTRGMGVSLLQSLPMFGALKAVATPAAGAVKAGMASAPAWGRTAGLSVGSATGLAMADEAQAQGKPVDPMMQAIHQAERKPYQAELDYFKGNPHVAGMATEDNRVIANPYSKISPEEMQAVKLNELARIHMRVNGSPSFGLTKEQDTFLNGNTYKDASPQDRAATIAARLLSGDPSAGQPSDEQLKYVSELRNGMMKGKR